MPEAGEKESRAQSYSRIKYSLAACDIFYSLALLVIFLISGFSKMLALNLSAVSQSSYFIVPAYLFIVSLGFYILNFPLNLYQSYILEHKFSLTNQKISNWALDQLKSQILSFIFILILVSAFYAILKAFPRYWWFMVSAFWITFSIGIAKILPVLIIPLFFKYKKVDDEALRERVIALARKMQVKILDVFEIDFSKKTLKANAAFVGLGGTRRVLLADTLRNKYTHDEIEIILAHEFAHYKLKHLIKMVLVNSVVTFALFYLIFRTSGWALNIFELSSLSDIAALPLAFLYFSLFGLIIQPLSNFISRAFESDADRLSIQFTGNKTAFVSAMNKLADQNLADRSPHPLIKLFFFDHPPIDERLKLAEKVN
jgi:STE24 endopeptidase